MARTTQVDDTVERKALLEAFEETTMSNITLESESPQQAEAAPVVSAEQPQEKYYEWATPAGFVAPDRKPRSAQFVDEHYEARVRAQGRAIKKALPQGIAHELKRPITSQAEADRMGSMYRVHLERMAKEKNIKHYSFDNYVRFRAEKQVRWQGSPNQALQMLMESAYLDDASKSHLISLLDSPRKKKARR